MLDSDMSAQLQNYMGLLRRPFTINASLGDDAKSGEMRDLLQQIAGMSDKITLQLDGNDARKPSFALTRADAEHEDPAIAAFLALLARDIEAGRNVRGLPEDLARTMLEHAGHKVSLGDDFDEDVDI